ncbi:trehalose-6-phosphate synthase [Phyllobacterium sp. K27]
MTTISLSRTKKGYSKYYLGYANGVLWPLHYRLDLVQYRSSHFSGCNRVNRKFAAALMPYLKLDDTIWVQDYHLITFARSLRNLGCRQRIGFFLHIPFPPPEILDNGDVRIGQNDQGRTFPDRHGRRSVRRNVTAHNRGCRSRHQAPRGVGAKAGYRC